VTLLTEMDVANELRYRTRFMNWEATASRFEAFFRQGLVSAGSVGARRGADRDRPCAGEHLIVRSDRWIC
jgi:hypothetical protein